MSSKVFAGCRFKRMRSFKTKSAAKKYATNCRIRGFRARTERQSGPRIKNPYVVFATKTCR